MMDHDSRLLLVILLEETQSAIGRALERLTKAEFPTTQHVASLRAEGVSDISKFAPSPEIEMAPLARTRSLGAFLPPSQSSLTPLSQELPEQQSLGEK